MAWVPKYKSEGLFGPYIAPCAMGSLVDICDHHGSYYETYDNAGGYYESWSGGDHFYTWIAMGVSFRSRLESILKGAEGDGMHTGVEIAELEFIKPQGAQYYKQTLVLIGQYEAQNRVQRIGEHDGIIYTLEYLPCEIGVTGYYRREYATPYSDPVATPIQNVPIIAVNFNIKLNGERKLEPNTYFFENGYFCCNTYTYNSKKFLGFAFYTRNERQDWDQDPAQNASGIMSGIGDATMLELFGVDIPEEQEDPNEDDEEDEDSGPGHGGSGGGNGDHVLPDYPITIPPAPTIGPCSVSWLTTYMMSAQDLDDFGQDLVNPDAMQKLKQFFNDPLDAIVGINMCPVIAGPRYSKTPTIHGTIPYEWSRSFMAILNQYSDIDCGIVSIEPFWDSCFDFDPYTRFTLFLPFIGYRDINADEIMGTNVHIMYRVDVVTGDCTAYVAKAAPSESVYGPMPEQIIAQFNGNCGVSVPIGRIDRNAALESTFSLLAGGIGIGVAGAASAAGLVDSSDLTEGQLASQAAHSTMTAVNSMKTKIERSGAISGNAGYLGYLKPYFIRKIARQSLPDNYKEIMGYPCNKPGPLRNYEDTGLAVVEDIQLNNIPAFGDELAEIISLLKGGVLI